MQQKKLTVAIGATLVATLSTTSSTLNAAPVAGGTLDPTIIPKYVIPLVIPPVMANAGTADDYNIAVRQFKQQILPGGIWNTINNRTDAFPATTVWSYGPDTDPTPAIAPATNSQFNYPAYTIEATAFTPVTVDWMNELVANPDACKASAAPATDPACNFIPHITPVDRTLHWANPEKLPCVLDKGGGTDCAPDATQLADPTILQQPYDGPVPMVTHVHGAHVGPESDGYPEAWWLPDANNIPATYATQGRLVNKYAVQTNNTPGVASFSYPNDQPSTTLWYHDHSLGMTRNNVYAGPAGFWLIRSAGGGEDGLVSGVLPGPAPVAGQAVLDLNTPGNAVRQGIREIPIVIQDRSFNADGSLFYPDNRAFFQEVKVSQVQIPFIGDNKYPSDIAPIWNPEAFFNVMVVNGVAWPNLEVEPDLYRFRLLNGSNSRFINLSLQALDAAGAVLGEVPFYQIGAEQSLLPQVVEVKTGFKTALPGDGTIPAAVPASAPEEALLMGLAERADVIVDFSSLPANTVKVRMLNTGPDAPFGGFPAVPLADPGTTGQVMEFTLVTDTPAGEDATPPQNLALSLPDPGDTANTASTFAGARDLALIEEESQSICVTVAPNGVVQWDKKATPDTANPGTCIEKRGTLSTSVPMAPKAAVLGTNGASTQQMVTLWSDDIQTNPSLGGTETWEIWNWTVDAHPIHVHLVKYKVVNREAFDPLTGVLSGSARPAGTTEAGWKDTLIAYPGEVTRFNATFDVAGLYVWHCHIVEHEDNEMMVPFCVGDMATASGCAAAGPQPL